MNGFRSISGCFFAIGAGPKIGEGDGETKRERDSKMDGMQTELDAKIAQAEARIANILLMEMIEALEARGHIKRSDIAGALLRMEWRAQLADRVEEEDSGDITHHSALAKLTIDEWGTRFALPPELYTLRKAQEEWFQAGEEGRSPLYPDRVIELFSEAQE